MVNDGYIMMDNDGSWWLHHSWGDWNHGILWLFHSVGNFIIPTDELICLRGVELTNQLLKMMILHSFVGLPEGWVCFPVRPGEGLRNSESFSGDPDLAHSPNGKSTKDWGKLFFCQRCCIFVGDFLANPRNPIGLIPEKTNNLVWRFPMVDGGWKFP